MELPRSSAGYCAAKEASPMRKLLLPALAALILAAAPARAADQGAAEGNPVAAFWDVLVAERASAPPPAETEFVRSFTDGWGVPCREYVQRVVIAEEEVEASGTVCRAADGSWAIRD
jgi:hypothetical protein